MKKKDYIKSIDGAERRFFMAPVSVEKRTEGQDGPAVIEGMAALYNHKTDMGWFEEEILPGAFDEVMNDDVRCLFNHNPNYVLARSNQGKGTLQLYTKDNGLAYRYTTPNRSYAKDLADAIEKGDVSQSSFAFKAKETIWVQRSDEKELRQIKLVENLYDVSPVTYPAYADTSVAKRSHEAAAEERQEENNGPSFDDFNARYLINKNSNILK